MEGALQNYVARFFLYSVVVVALYGVGKLVRFLY
jgi:hypothetical protein